MLVRVLDIAIVSTDIGEMAIYEGKVDKAFWIDEIALLLKRARSEVQKARLLAHAGCLHGSTLQIKWPIFGTCAAPP